MPSCSEFSDAEIRAINAFRDRVSDILEGPYEDTAAYLCRWLVEQKFDLAAAERRLRVHKDWRKVNKIDDIVNEDMYELEERFPMASHGTDPSGHPVFLSRFRDWKLHEFLSERGEEGRARFVRYNIKMAEVMCQEIRKRHAETNGRIHEAVIIFDFTDFSLRKEMSGTVISTLMDLTKIMEPNYSGQTKRTYVVNAPKAWRIFFAIFKPFISARAVERIRFMNSERAAKHLNLDGVESNQEQLSR